MDAEFERMLARAATIDELLSDAYRPCPDRRATLTLPDAASRPGAAPRPAVTGRC